MSTAAPKTEELPRADLIDNGSGPVLLMLHGWGASKDLFSPLLRYFSGFRLVVPDLPGFGGTPLPPQPWSADDYAQWVVTLMDRLKLPSVHLLGHSHGGRVAIKLASRHPDRVAKLVLVAAAGIRSPRRPVDRLRVTTYKLLRRLEKSSALPEGLRQWARERAERRGSEDYRAATGVMRATLVRLVNEDLRAELPQVAAPTLLIWGDKDDQTPLANARLMEKLIPDSGLVVFEGRGHFAYLEEAPRFANIVNTFLHTP